jgi:hypothetical protein
MGLFLDLLHVPERITNDALEGIYKAMSDGHDHGDDGIWKPHESTLIRRLIELFTQRGLTRLDSVHKELLAWKSGHRHVPSNQVVPQPPGTLQRWNDAELSLVKLYIESLPPAKWTLSDHMMAIDYVCQRYLSPDEMVMEAEWLSTRAALMGKVQANLDKPPAAKDAEKLLQAMPSTVAGAAMAYKLTPMFTAVMQFAAQRSAENVRALSDSVRHRMRSVIAADLEQRALGGVPAGTSSLETKLSDEFATLNRDWRRIAVTEAGEAQLQGFIASLKPGDKVKRVERYDNACAFCRQIDGRVATVVEPDAANKDPDTMIWPGKNNIGRSASPRKRVGDLLVPREPDEMWWLPAGLAHPHCRGRWVPVEADDPDDDPAFAAELRAILGP